MGGSERLRDQVATRVMRWTSGRVEWAYDGSAEMWHSSDGVPLIPREAWRPDEDDEQCMQVVDRMVALGFRCTIDLHAGDARAVFSRAGSPVPAAAAGRRLAVLEAALAAIHREGVDASD